MQHAIKILQAQGWSISRIATAWGVPRIWVYRQINPSDRIPRVNKPQNKNVARVKEMRAAGMLYKQIAYDLGISKMTAQRWNKL